jgi:hypothetical protein
MLEELHVRRPFMSSLPRYNWKTVESGVKHHKAKSKASNQKLEKHTLRVQQFDFHEFEIIITFLCILCGNTYVSNKLFFIILGSKLFYKPIVWFLPN